MGQVRALTQRLVAAPAGQVFDALADYTVARPKMLPDQYSEYAVHEGGVGAGTVASWRLRATETRVREVRASVTEPAEATLVETDANSSMVVVWTVGSNGPHAARVTVEATWDGATGIGGYFERRFAPKGLNRIHDQVLAGLAAHVEGH